MARDAHVGRPGSWVAVGIMILGFVIGGVGLIMGPSWPVFWAGAGIVALGMVVAMVVDIFSDVVLDDPRVLPEIVDYSPIGGRGHRLRGGPYGETADKPTIHDTEDFPHG